GDGSVTVRDNLIEDCADMGIGTHYDWPSIEVVDNQIRGSTTGIDLHAYAAGVRGNTVLGCLGDAIRLDLEQGTVEGNVVGRSGGHGISLTHRGYGSVEVHHNTVYSHPGSGIV